MIITKTPFRMSFFGGGTDMESFFRKYGGAAPKDNPLSGLPKGGQDGSDHSENR